MVLGLVDRTEGKLSFALFPIGTNSSIPSIPCRVSNTATSQPKTMDDIIFYDPNQPELSRSGLNRKKPHRPAWQRLAERVARPAPDTTEPLDVAELLHSCQPCESDTSGSHGHKKQPLEFASEFARRIHASGSEVAVQQLLLISICSVLSISGRASPEELDVIIRTVSKSSGTRYLDRIKRGAKMANEIISEWALEATQSKENPAQRLHRATQAVLQGMCIVCLEATEVSLY